MKIEGYSHAGKLDSGNEKHQQGFSGRRGFQWI
jgi:hypothetical protein